MVAKNAAGVLARSQEVGAVVGFAIQHVKFKGIKRRDGGGRGGRKEDLLLL